MDPDAPLGRKAVEAGLLTEAQLDDVRRELAGQAKAPSLADALIAKGLLTRLQVEGFLSGDAVRRIGKYRLIRELGRGGMGVVYEAEDVELKRRCALKTMIETEGVDAKERAVEEERFVREARLSANLPRHPGIVGVYDAGVVDGRRVIAMELIEGLQFQDWRKKGPPTLRQQVQALLEVAEAVAHAHEHNVIHRDLKPSNILVDAQRRPKVTDFGLAKRSRETTVFALTASGLIVGTPAYMSPEQAEAKDDVGPSTDQWALGVMLYEILAGRLPFRGASAVEVLMKTVKEPVVPPTRALRGKVDERLERICMRALKKEPAERYPSVRAFAEQLGVWLKGGTIRGAPAPKKPAWLPWAAAGGALAVLLILVLAFRSPGVDVPGLVAEGKRLIEAKNYPDALIMFGRALAEDPANEPARAGKREAQRLLTSASTAAESVAAVRKLIDEGDVTGALAALERAPEKDRTELRASLRRRMESLLPGLKERAVAARRNGDAGQVGALTREVEAWKQADLAESLKAALAADSKPPPVPPPPPSTAYPRRHSLKDGDNGVTALAFSPDGKRLFSGSFLGMTKIWDLETGRPLLERKLPLRSAAAEFSRDGRWIAAGMGNGDIQLYDTATLQSRTLKAHTAQTLGVAFMPDSRKLVSASVDGALRTWSLPDGVPGEGHGGHPGGAFSLALSPDGRTAAVGSADGPVWIWDLVSMTRTDILIPPRKGVMHSVAMSPDGRKLAAGGQPGQLWVWDLATRVRRDVAVLKPEIFRIAWSPDGRWIAAASKDDALRLYDATSGELKAGFTSPGGWWSCAFSADGRLLAGGDHEHWVHTYDVSALK